MRNSVFLIWTLLLIVIIDLHAQEKDRHEFLVEADPLPFIMGGVSGHFGWSPKKSEHFTWYPFKKQNFYLRPWAGIGYQSVITGTIEPDKVDTDLNVGNLEYHLTPLMPFASVHLGYRF
jgi:hypothetical protein